MPEGKEFASAIPQSHRKGEKAWHIKAFIGSKDGYLFLLSTGILYGFRKPLSFFPFDRIESISYTSVLQRTFNLVITAFDSKVAGEEQSKTSEVEFSMIDQTDFSGIDEYVKRHGLNDASMGAERRAKKFNVNPPRRREGPEAGGAMNGGGDAAEGEEEEESELKKAEQQIEDEEDEEEEDYDPGSEGESEGEGDDSEEEEANGDDGQEIEEVEGEVEEEEEDI